MIRIVIVLFGLAVAHAATAQPAPPTKPTPSAKPAKPTKPAAQKPRAPKGEPVASGPCIGVIAHVGPFSVQQIGLVVFANDLKEVPVPAWGLDDLVVARVRAAAGPGANVRKIAYAPDAFAAYDKPASSLFRNSEQELAAVVRSVAETGGCERYVAVVRGATAFLSTNQTVTGVGVLNHLSIRTYLFAVTLIRVYDGRSFAVLKRGAGGGRIPLFSGMFEGTGIRGPSREIKGLPWPPGDAIATLRDDTRGMLAESLDKALPELLAP